MYAFIEGEVCEKTNGSLILLAAGVGWQLNCSNNTLQAAPALGEKMRCYTFLSVREDAMELFGFHSKEELDTFRLLIGVSGVGPKMAIGILSAFTPENFAAIICSEDAKSLSKAPGIGGKTAARIVLELKEKISGSAITALPTAGGRAAPVRMSGKLSEAAEALVGLGFNRAEVTDIIRTLDTANMSREEIVTAALKRFAKPQ